MKNVTPPPPIPKYVFKGDPLDSMLGKFRSSVWQQVSICKIKMNTS